MDIIHDYDAIGPLVKGDTWWTAEKKAKEPVTLETLPVPEALKPFEKRASAFLKEMARLDCSEPSPLARMIAQRRIEEAALLEKEVQRFGRAMTYRTSLPSTTWRQFTSGQ